MRKYLYPIFTILFFTNFLMAQSAPEPCDLQVRIGISICIDAPGCIIFQASPIGGTPPFTYEWENGVTTQSNPYFNPTNPYQGTCEAVTVTDVNGCTAKTGLIFNAGQTPPDFGLTPDTIIVEGTPINFDVSDNDTLPGVNYELVQSPTYGEVTFDGNGQGTYTPDTDYCGPDYFTYLVVDDSCHYSENITVTVFNGPCDKVFVTSSDCNNGCTGSAFFYHQGVFIPPLNYNWSNGGTDRTVSGLCSGNAAVTVTDDIGNSMVYQFVIEDRALEITIDGIDVACQSSRIRLSPVYSQTTGEDLFFTWSGPGIYSTIQHDTTQLVRLGQPNDDNIFQLITSASNGCTDTAFHTVTVLESPYITICFVRLIR